MANGLEALEGMEYPGRMIILGRNMAGDNIVVYGLSGRSPPSKARRIAKSGDERRVFTVPTDPEELKKGNPALLIYDAINLVDRRSGRVIASNGAQTPYINEVMNRHKKKHNGKLMPIQGVLPAVFFKPHYTEGIDVTSFEPDRLHTPRVTGLMEGEYAVLSIIKEDTNGTRAREYHEVSLSPGQGRLIATYDGPNPPEPASPQAFQGSPRDVYFGRATSSRTIANQAYEALGEFAVATACMNVRTGEVAVKNLHR